MGAQYSRFRVFFPLGRGATLDIRRNRQGKRSKSAGLLSKNTAADERRTEITKGTEPESSLHFCAFRLLYAFEFSGFGSGIVVLTARFF